MANSYLEKCLLAGQQSLARRDFQGAVELFEAVLKIDIFHEKAWFGLIEIFKIDPKLLRKIEISSTFLLRQPRKIEAEGEFELARVFYVIILAISRGCKEASSAIKRLSIKSRRSEDKQKTSKLLQMAHQKRKEKKNKEAIGLYKQVLQKDPFNKGALSWLQVLVAAEEKKKKPSRRQDLVRRNSFWNGVNQVPCNRTASAVSGIR